MEHTAAGEVWGIGRRIEEQLKEAGVHTVFDLVNADVPTIRKRWGVVLKRTALELQGV